MRRKQLTVLAQSALRLVGVAWAALGGAVILISAIAPDSDRSFISTWIRLNHIEITVSFVITICALSILFRLFSHLYRYRVRRMFGLSKDFRVTVVIPTFHISDINHINYEYCFKYTNDASKMRITSGPKEICGLADVMCISDAIQSQSQFRFIEFDVLPDQTYIGPNADDIIFGEYSKGKSFICFGSPYSNYLTERLYSISHGFAYDKNLYHFDGVDYLVSNKALDKHRNDVGHEFPIIYMASNERDYAVIARISTRGRVFVICAGVRFPGTSLAMKYFFANWYDFYKKAKGNDFFRIFEIDVRSSAMHPLGPLMVRENGSDVYTPL